jgi:hypothetical protein
MSIIDNIFFDITRVSNFMTSPIINGLSDQDAQTLEIYTKNFDRKKDSIKTKSITQINKFTINEFKNKLSEELWKGILENPCMDVNIKFNSFLKVYLQIINSSFPKIKVHERQSNQWITNFFLIPFYLQAVQIHLVHGAKLLEA